MHPRVNEKAETPHEEAQKRGKADDCSPSKGVPERKYAFDLQLNGEIIPDVCISFPFNTFVFTLNEGSTAPLIAIIY